MKINNYFLITLLVLFQTCTLDSVYDPVTVSGKVSDVSGKGIEDVKVSIESASEKSSASTTSDGDYSIRLSSAGAAARIIFSKDGYTAQSTSVAIRGGEKASLNITLSTSTEEASLSTKKQNK